MTNLSETSSPKDGPIQAEIITPGIVESANISSIHGDIESFAKFIVDRAGKTAVSIISTCAMDDNPYWKLMFKMGMADAISEDASLEDEFFARMYAKPGLPHAHKIMDAYLKGMPADRRKKLFSMSGMKKRGRHFPLFFHEASFNTFDGSHILKTLKVLISHGLLIQEIMDQNIHDIERAAVFGHSEFLKTLTETGSKIPLPLISGAVKRIKEPEKLNAVLALMIDECGISLEEVIENAEIYGNMDEKTRSYLNARLIRKNKICEGVMDPEEEDFFDLV